jgi:Protein of unknown function (DUF3551)
MLAIVSATFAALAIDADLSCAQAAAWCLRSGDGGGGCGYHTFEQCQASRAGGSSHCVPNPNEPSNAAGSQRRR